MNDNWLEIIEILTSISNANKLSLKGAMESCLRMLGWKTSNHSMTVNFKTSSGVIIDIVLGINDADGYKVGLPILISSNLNNKVDDSIIIKNIKSDVDCKSIILVGKTIDLYYNADNTDYECIEKIPFEKNNETGAKLANMLPVESFNINSINLFFDEIYQSSLQKFKLKTCLCSILNNKDKAKEVLKTYLELEGFEGDYVEEQLNEIEIDIHYKSEQVSEPTQVPYVKTKSNGHNLTKFSINGGPMLSKKRFVQSVVSLFVKEHPSVTLEELEKQFPSEVISKERGIVRPLEKVKEMAFKTSDDIFKRYNTEEEDIIHLADGTDVVVYNQWGMNTFPKFLPIAQSLYDIKSSQPFPNTDVCLDAKKPIQSKKEGIFKFSLAGIQVGETITFDLSGIQVKVVSDREIEYQGTVYKLSPFVRKFIPDNLRSASDSYRGPNFFSYKGTVLTELRNAHEGKSIQPEKVDNGEVSKGIHITAQALDSFKSNK